MSQPTYFSNRSTARIFLFLLAASAMGCMGTAELNYGKDPTQLYPNRPDVEGGSLTACQPVPSPGRTPLRRLTNEEYDNTIEALLGLPGHHSADFPADLAGLGFTTNADAFSVSVRHTEKYLEAAEKLAAAANLSALLPCTATTDACATQFIEAFGFKAFRRPLKDDQKARLKTVFTAGKNLSNFATGIRMVIETVLQSPEFLYRPEFGVASSGAEVVPLDDHEMATRLSYFLWGTMPDSVLFAAASRGELQTGDQILAQARRMIADPRAHKTVARFNSEWLHLDHLNESEKDETLFPNWAVLKPLMRKETELFLEDVFWNPDSDVSALFSSKTSWMNQTLANFYGVTGPTSAEFVKVTLDPTKRQGLLTQASLMAALASTNESHPVHRGRFVRQQLFCQFLPPPPPGVQIIPPEPDPNLTTRERFAEHSTNAVCAGCHSMMDPIGFGFENYDAIGAHRTTENGKPINATGTLTKTSVDGDFNGPIELSTRLAGAQEVRECVTTMWFRFAAGRQESSEDECTLEYGQKLFDEAQGKLPELLVAITQTDAFRYRKAVVPGGQP
jgi:hypothetical protein